MYYWLRKKSQKEFIQIEKEEYEPTLFKGLTSKSFKKENISFKIHFTKNKTTLSQDILKAITIFIVSSKMKNILSKNDEDKSFLEFYPISLVESKTKKIDKESYWIVNILNDINCFDIDKSKFEYDDDSIGDIEKLVLKKEPIGDRNIFRMTEENRSYIFISEKLKNIMEKEEITGYKLVPEKDFHQPYLEQ